MKKKMLQWNSKSNPYLKIKTKWQGEKTLSFSLQWSKRHPGQSIKSICLEPDWLWQIRLWSFTTRSFQQRQMNMHCLPWGDRSLIQGYCSTGSRYGSKRSCVAWTSAPGEASAISFCALPLDCQSWPLGLTICCLGSPLALRGWPAVPGRVAAGRPGWNPRGMGAVCSQSRLRRTLGCNPYLISQKRLVTMPLVRTARAKPSGEAGQGGKGWI